MDIEDMSYTEEQVCNSICLDIDPRNFSRQSLSSVGLQLLNERIRIAWFCVLASKYQFVWALGLTADVP